MNRPFYIFLCLICLSLTVYSQDYYWYGNKKVFLIPATQHFVLVKKTDNVNRIKTNWHTANKFISTLKEPLLYGVIDNEILAKIDGSSIIYKIPTYRVASTNAEVYPSHLFYVKLKSDTDVEVLQKYARQHNVTIEYHSEIMSMWYVLSGLNSEKNSLELANLFYESGLFEVSEPDWWNETDALCVDDALFPSQWNLNNTGQYSSAYTGIDINFCDVYTQVPANSNIVIAVLDQGIQLDHPDLSGNIVDSGYDTDSHSSPSVVSGNHGTACAGIIGAISNNDLNVSGIASNCKLMSISNTLGGNYLSRFNRAEGITYAANHGAAIISNSWGSSCQLSVIDDAIYDALRNGRNGKGCIVVFAAGNADDSVSYPANLNDSILVVGAMSPCGERKNPSSCDHEDWGSNFGSQLDVVAPGVLIPTTDRTGSDGYAPYDYYMNFNGTSSACPHVAAVAGLILSVNPYLSQKEVADIIESTARKIGGYSYTTHANRPNGIWNIEMGYGLVDAYAAIVEAKARLPIQGPEQMCDTAKYYLIRPSQPGETVLWSIDNSQILYPTYSIVGPNNQDTVIIACDDETIPHRDRLIPLFGHTKYLHATITNSDTTITYSKVLRHTVSEVPTISASNSNIGWLPRTQRTFTVSNCTAVPDSALKWTVRRIIPPRNPNYSPTVITNYYYGRTLTYSAPTVPQTRVDTLEISVSNLAGECGVANSNTLRFILLPSLPLLNAYVEGEILNISITEENDNRQQVLAQLNDDSSYTLELWHSIYGCMRAQVVSGATEQMSVTGLPSGIYVLLLKENGNIIAETKIQIP